MRSHARGSALGWGAPTAAFALVAAAGLTLSACGGSKGGGSSETISAGHSSKAAEARREIVVKVKRFGSNATAAQARSAEAALHGYLDARASSEWSKGCSYLARSIRRLLSRFATSKSVNGNGCAAGLESTASKLSPSERAAFADVGVSSVRVDGDRGYVTYEAGGIEYAIPTATEAGVWKLAAGSGTPLKP